MRRCLRPAAAKYNCISNALFPHCTSRPAKKCPMGIGPPILALYRQLKLVEVLHDIEHLVELGSQAVWCPDHRLMRGLFEAFGRPVPPVTELELYVNKTGTGRVASRHLHESLGFKYDCVDIDGNFGALTFDINFDTVPPRV